MFQLDQSMNLTVFHALCFCPIVCYAYLGELLNNSFSQLLVVVYA